MALRKLLAKGCRRLSVSAISKVMGLLGRQVDLVDLDDATPIVRRLLGSGYLVCVA